MWARVSEVMLGLWLVVSPFIFRHPFEQSVWWVNDMACGVLVIVLALLSFWYFPIWTGLRYAHLGILAVALWLISVAFFTAGYPAAPALQNNMTLGLLLLMLALVPTDPEIPPRSWQEMLARELEQDQ